mgnify:FL=1
MTVGSSISEAFRRIFYLEKSCESQIKALAGDSELILPSREVCEHAAGQFKISASQSGLEWPGLLRLLDNKGSNFRN